MKVLLFAKERNLKNAGGPSGYLFNISEYLNKYPNENIEFINERKLKRTIWGSFIYYSYQIIRRTIKFSNKALTLLDLFYIDFCHEYFTQDTIDYFNSFDYIHIHSAALCINTFYHNKTTAKIVITSHSPEPFSDEFIAKIGIGNIICKYPSIRDYLLKKEIASYDFCDRIMFPVPQAREPYMQASMLFKESFKKNEFKFFYVPTALSSVEMVTGNGNYLANDSKDEDIFKVCYIGRHNSIKGYDTLKKAASNIWSIDSNVYFYIAGKEEPLKGHQDIRWKELGWVNTPLLLNEIDVFVLPNKQTYFDLILLEVLRQGTPVVLTRTGGNKWFEQYELPGLFFYEYGDSSAMVEQILKVKSLKENGCLEKIKEANRSFLKEKFNMPLYFESYLDQLYHIKEHDNENNNS